MKNETGVSLVELSDFRMTQIKNIVHDSRAYALEMGHAEVGLGTGLIGLSHNPEIGKLLAEFGISKHLFIKKAQEVLPRRSERSDGVLPLSDELERAMGLAVRKSDMHMSKLVRATDLLASILESRSPVVFQVLDSADIDYVDLSKLMNEHTAPFVRLKLLRKRVNGTIDNIQDNASHFSSVSINSFVDNIGQVLDKNTPRRIQD